MDSYTHCPVIQESERLVSYVVEALEIVSPEGIAFLPLGIISVRRGQNSAFYSRVVPDSRGETAIFDFELN
jgi:hypothetical protein